MMKASFKITFVVREKADRFEKHLGKIGKIL
jgi:hypothetical protein